MSVASELMDPGRSPPMSEKCAHPVQDPHELYKHWSVDLWGAIDQHPVKAGMNELQASFAIGLGIPEKSGEPGNRTVNYPNGGNPLSITYSNDKAAEIKPGIAN